MFTFLAYFMRVTLQGMLFAVLEVDIGFFEQLYTINMLNGI